jgi:hypothetical protein
MPEQVGGEPVSEEGDPSARVRFMLDRQDEAYRRSPSGPWWKRWLPGMCKHERVRCTHGDEIIGRRWRRRVCLNCGRSLKGPLPVECFFTGGTHG